MVAIFLNASAFEATNVFGRDNLHKFELGWHPMEVAADGNNVGRVLEEAEPRWVNREHCAVTHGPIDGEGHCFAPLVVQRFPSCRSCSYVLSRSFAHGLL